MLYVVSACRLKYKVVLRINMKQNRLYEIVNKRRVYIGQVSVVLACDWNLSELMQSCCGPKGSTAVAFLNLPRQILA